MKFPYDLIKHKIKWGLLNNNSWVKKKNYILQKESAYDKWIDGYYNKDYYIVIDGKKYLPLDDRVNEEVYKKVSKETFISVDNADSQVAVETVNQAVDARVIAEEYK
jgi:hypothetical protein